MRELHNLPCFDPECGGQSSCSFFLKNKEGNYAPHLHCFKCNKQQWNVSDEDYLIMDKNLVALYSKDTPDKGNNLLMDRKELFPQRGIVTSLEDRYIGKEAAEKYRVEKLFRADTNEPYGYSYPAYDAQGNFIAQKVKRFDKKMKWLYQGEGMPEHQMFGQSLFPKGGRYITIVEGEEDALACYQMLKANSPSFDHPVISVFNGASTAAKECKAQWEYINSFENIIIAFDGDEVGRKASEEVAKLFHFRPKIVLFGECKKDAEGKYQWKDANDYLKGKREKDFINLWWRAERFTPKGVLTFGSLWDSMTKKDTDLVIPLPWKGLEKMLHGLRTGRYYIFKAKPKIGKTQLFKELAYHVSFVTENPQNSGLILLESTKKEIGIGMCALHMNRPIMFPDIPYTREELETAHIAMSKEDKFTVFDPEDVRTVENIMAKILYFVKAHNVKYIFLDHLSMLAYQNGDSDERRFLDKLNADLKALTTSLDICICAITHVNDDGETRGSRSFAQLCDFLISLHRDKLSADPVTANTTEVIVEENRLTGESGPASKLFFNMTTGRMTEIDMDLKFDV